MLRTASALKRIGVRWAPQNAGAVYSYYRRINYCVGFFTAAVIWIYQLGIWYYAKWIFYADRWKYINAGNSFTHICRDYQRRILYAE